MKNLKKVFCVFAALLILMSTSVMAASATEIDQAGTEIEAIVTGTDHARARAEGVAVCKGYTDIRNNNHAFNKAVEVWAECETYLQNWSSSTANGIPDWTLMAFCQLWVSNGDVSYVTSPTASVYDGTYTMAKTKEVNAKDGGEASATGYHTIKDYYGEIAWDTTTKATEKF